MTNWRSALGKVSLRVVNAIWDSDLAAYDDPDERRGYVVWALEGYNFVYRNPENEVRNYSTY